MGPSSRLTAGWFFTVRGSAAAGEPTRRISRLAARLFDEIREQSVLGS